VSRVYGDTSAVTRKRKTHVVDGRNHARTLCGLLCACVDTINMRTDEVESATCRTCGRVDDARSVKTHRAGVEP